MEGPVAHRSVFFSLLSFRPPSQKRLCFSYASLFDVNSCVDKLIEEFFAYAVVVQCSQHPDPDKEFSITFPRSKIWYEKDSKNWTSLGKEKVCLILFNRFLII